jgi:hypothetical protein
MLVLVPQVTRNLDQNRVCQIQLLFQNTLSAFTVEGTQSRCASSHELSIRGVTRSDIDAEDVFEAVTPFEANAAPARAVAVSLAFSEGYAPAKVEEVTVQQQKRKRRQIERNRDVRQ